MGKGNPNQRIDKKFAEDMKKIMEIRFKGGLSDISEMKRTGIYPKATQLVTRTQSYHELLKELKTKPERKTK